MSTNERTNPAISHIILDTTPEPLEVDLNRAVIVVIDMQNAFISNGGMFDLWGREISRYQRVIGPTEKIIYYAHSYGIKVIYVAHQYAPDLHDSGGPASPNWYKSFFKSYREHPEWRNKMQFCGTWGGNIIDELKPQEGDLLVIKSRYSAFFGTNLDTILKTFNAKYLFFVGVATNICVETSIRDAFNLEYYSILISDATMNNGPQFLQEATLYNIERCFGWVITSDKVIQSITKENSNNTCKKNK